MTDGIRASRSIPAAMAASRPTGARISAVSDLSAELTRVSGLHQGFVDVRPSRERRASTPWKLVSGGPSVMPFLPIRYSRIVSS